MAAVCSAGGVARAAVATATEMGAAAKALAAAEEGTLAGMEAVEQQ